MGAYLLEAHYKQALELDAVKGKDTAQVNKLTRQVAEAAQMDTPPPEADWPAWYRQMFEIVTLSTRLPESQSLLQNLLQNLLGVYFKHRAHHLLAVARIVSEAEELLEKVEKIEQINDLKTALDRTLRLLNELDNQISEPVVSAKSRLRVIQQMGIEGKQDAFVGNSRVSSGDFEKIVAQAKDDLRVAQADALHNLAGWHRILIAEANTRVFQITQTILKTSNVTSNWWDPSWDIVVEPSAWNVRNQTLDAWKKALPVMNAAVTQAPRLHTGSKNPRLADICFMQELRMFAGGSVAEVIDSTVQLLSDWQRGLVHM